MSNIASRKLGVALLAAVLASPLTEAWAQPTTPTGASPSGVTGGDPVPPPSPSPKSVGAVETVILLILQLA